MKENLLIKSILDEEMNDALDLVWRVFLEFEAPDYTEEGIKEFKKCIDDKKWVSLRKFYGAFTDKGQIVGVIATYNKSHIALFFVDGKYHYIYNLNDKDYFTVNSSPYAHEVYKHLGFVDTDKEQCVNGLKYYPMKKMKD